MSEGPIIRSATADDRPHLRQAIVELQDYERSQHTTRLPGERVADEYLDWMLSRAQTEGAVLVAQSAGIFLGFVAGWIEETENIGETSDSNRVGYISDICVMTQTAWTPDRHTTPKGNRAAFFRLRNRALAHQLTRGK
jgi:hypothetical protein